MQAWFAEHLPQVRTVLASKAGDEMNVHQIDGLAVECSRPWSHPKLFDGGRLPHRIQSGKLRGSGRM
jgi:hypothetical protein